MRKHHAIIIGLISVIAIGFGARLFLFSGPPADADALTGASINVYQMQVDLKEVPQSKMHDMSTVFSVRD